MSMNSETAVNKPYPEILKFCDWFKKQHEEKGLQYVKLSLHNPLGMKISLPGEEVFDPKDFTNWFGKSVFFTPVIIDGLKDYILLCVKTEALDHFEKVCAEFNHIENLLECGETKPLPGLF